MKLNRSSHPPRARERGFFLVIVMLIMASIMMIYVAANSRRLTNLKNEIRLVEQKQVQRLNHPATVATNNIATPTVVSAAAP